MAGIYDKDNKKVSSFLESVSKAAGGGKKKRKKKEEESSGGSWFSKLKDRIGTKTASTTATEQLKKRMER
jgi:hypothetical protein